MKIWEILKEENVGKIYRYNNINYEIYEAIAALRACRRWQRRQLP